MWQYSCGAPQSVNKKIQTSIPLSLSPLIHSHHHSLHKAIFVCASHVYAICRPNSHRKNYYNKINTNKQRSWVVSTSNTRYGPTTYMHSRAYSFAHISYALIISMIMNLWIQSLFLWIHFDPFESIDKRRLLRGCCHYNQYGMYADVVLCLVWSSPFVCFITRFWWWLWVNYKHNPESIINSFMNDESVLVTYSLFSLARSFFLLLLYADVYKLEWTPILKNAINREGGLHVRITPSN